MMEAVSLPPKEVTKQSVSLPLDVVELVLDQPRSETTVFGEHELSHHRSYLWQGGAGKNISDCVEVKPTVFICGFCFEKYKCKCILSVKMGCFFYVISHFKPLQGNNAMRMDKLYIGKISSQYRRFLCLEHHLTQVLITFNIKDLFFSNIITTFAMSI